MGNCCTALLLDDESSGSYASSRASTFFPFKIFKWNQVTPDFIKEHVELNNESVSSSNKIPPGLWEILVDGDTRRSVISAITMDESLCRLGKEHSEMGTVAGQRVRRLSQHLIPDNSTKITAPTVADAEGDDGSNGDENKPRETSPEGDQYDDDVEEENSRFTKAVIASYLETVTADNQKVTSLLHKLQKIEVEREEMKSNCATPRTAYKQSEERNAVICNIREEFKKALSTNEAQ